MLIGFANWRGFKSKLVTWITGSKWDHVWLEFYDPTWSGYMIAHASSKGVVVQPKEVIAHKNPKEIAYFRVLPSTNFGLSKNRTTVGVGYDYLTLFYNAFLLVLKKVFKKAKLRPKRNPKKMTCSEFVAKVLKDSHILDRDIVPEYIKPGELYNLLQKDPKFVKENNIV